MATRPVFLPGLSSNVDHKVQELAIDFVWHPGFSISQKQKSIYSLHKNIVSNAKCENPLEISSKSPDPVGVALSAFNLMVRFKLKPLINSPVETIYQGSKVFNSQPRNDEDRYSLPPLEARRRTRILESTKTMTGWEIGDYHFSLTSGTDFYDWLYIGGLYQCQKLLLKLVNYDCFTDIEFNPRKSIACQARSAALARSLLEQRNGIQSYLRDAEEMYLKKNTEQQYLRNAPEIQLSMFD